MMAVVHMNPLPAIFITIGITNTIATGQGAMPV